MSTPNSSANSPTTRRLDSVDNDHRARLAQSPMILSLAAELSSVDITRRRSQPNTNIPINNISLMSNMPGGTVSNSNNINNPMPSIPIGMAGLASAHPAADEGRDEEDEAAAEAEARALEFGDASGGEGGEGREGRGGEQDEGFMEDLILGVSIAQKRKEERLLDILEKRVTAESKDLDSFNFLIRDEVVSEENALAGKWLFRACKRRRKYRLPKSPMDITAQPQPWLPIPTVDSAPPLKSHHVVRMAHGVISVFDSEQDLAANNPIHRVPDQIEFAKDLRATLQTIATGPIKSLAYRRLHMLEAKFRLHILLNDEREGEEAKRIPHRDFFNVRKVDTHVHHSSCMHQKHLLRFIRKKLKTSADMNVIERDGKVLTLKEVFESLRLSAYDLSIDTLDVHADRTLFHRFDRFNLKYNPFGQSRLREIFLKHDNLIGGLFLADLTREVFDDLERDKYQMAELRISIYGRSKAEWSKLASWVVRHGLLHNNVRWLIQVPRIAHLFIGQGIVKSFAEVLENIFLPLFEVTIDPASDPMLHTFLKHVVGFDSVDDESISERKLLHVPVDPATWTNPDPVPYWSYLYHMWANLANINSLRISRGWNAFSFRPHSGEAGDLDHVASAFLLADGINHGITIRKSPVLEYLFYLEQIGIAMSPMSNNSLFLSVDKNPFHRYFNRGLNVSLSTDDPLQFHHTHEPLIEEYGLAKQVFNLSNTDMCEIARNSVLQSGFEHEIKSYWLGAGYWVEGVEGNNIDRTNVANLRIALRYDLLCIERSFVARCMAKSNTLDRSTSIQQPQHPNPLSMAMLSGGGVKLDELNPSDSAFSAEALLEDLWPSSQSALRRAISCAIRVE